jgi:hypothetical protein
VIFYSDPSMALIGHAEATMEDFIPDERTQRAWWDAGQEWKAFGAMDIPTSWGHTVRLNSLQQFRNQADGWRKKLEELVPGLRDRIREQRLAELSPKERAAYESDKPLREMTEEEYQDKAIAAAALAMTDMDVAQQAPESVRETAIYYAKMAMETDVYAARVASYGQQVNYEYWKTRCEVEQSDATKDARQHMRFGDQAAEKADPEGAREEYEKAWDAWAKVFQEHPQLVNDVMALDLIEPIERYRRVLDQLDEQFPTDFKLQMLLDAIAENAPSAPPGG